MARLIISSPSQSTRRRNLGHDDGHNGAGKDCLALTAGKPLSAEQLLDLDDESFATALDSSYLGSRRGSSHPQLDQLLAAPNPTTAVGLAHGQGASLDPFSGSFASPSSLALPNPQFLPGNAYFGAHGSSAINPFADLGDQGTTGLSNHYHPPSSDHPALPDDATIIGTTQPAASTIHPIAIPGNTMPELTVGAKPVMPGSLAPQFGNNNTTPRKGVTTAATDIEMVPQSVEGNTPSGEERDPFADLIN